VEDLVGKPIIYIYPIEKMDVEVKLGNPQYLSCTYPKYKNGWSVTADVIFGSQYIINSSASLSLKPNRDNFSSRKVAVSILASKNGGK